MNSLRELIYRERYDLQEFFDENQLWEDLYDDLFFNLTGCIGWDLSALDVFNDSYYKCISVLIDKNPEDQFCSKFLEYDDFADCYTDTGNISLLICYTILSLSSHVEEKKFQRFFNRVRSHFSLGKIDSCFKLVENFLFANTKKYEFNIKVDPKAPENLDYVYGPELNVFWKRVLDLDFSTRNMRTILSLYSKTEDKINVLKQIGDAIESDLCLREEHSGYMTLFNELQTIGQCSPQQEDNLNTICDIQANSNIHSLAEDAYRLEIQRLQEETAKLKEELSNSKHCIELLENKLRVKENTDCIYQEMGKLSEQEINEISRTLTKDTIRNLVEAIVSFGEKYTSSQNDKAEVIRMLLLEKVVSDYIPKEILADEIKVRIDKLGRKEIAFNVNAECVYKISENKNVNIGNTK